MKRVSIVLWVLLAAGCVTSGDAVKRETSPKEAAMTNLRLGSEYLQRGDRETALDKLTRAVEQDPELAPAHAYLGLTYEQLGQIDEADRHYRAAIRLARDDAGVQNMYAVYLCRRDRVGEADKHFMAAVEIPHYSTPETAYTNAGVCQLKVSDTSKAEAYFREALGRNPRYPDALWQMARLTHEAGRDFQTRAFLQRLQEVAQLSAAALWLGYQVESALGDEQAADRYADKLMQSYPESVEAAELNEIVGRY